MASSSISQSALRLQPDRSSSSTPSRHPSHQASSSFRASPSPSATSQSDDQEQDELDEGEDEDGEDDYTDVGSSQFNSKERRNTLEAKGSAALAVSGLHYTSSEHWQVMPADARNASAATLPHEILLHIFKYVAISPPDLRKSLTVCKSWCLCGVELLWYRPSFHRIASLFKLIHIIRKPNQTFPYASYIRRLSLSALASELEDSLFGRLAVCTRLERLTLTGCTSITDDTIAAVLSQTKQLIAADFSEVTQLTDKSILAMANNCPRLQGMNISGCKMITSDAVAVLAKSCKLLRRMKLCGCELMADSALTSLAQNCPTLLEVDLVNCPLITDTSIREMWKHSFHMRELRLAQCGHLTDLAFPAPNSNLGAVNTAALGGMGSIAALHHQQYYYGGSESAPASRGVSPFYSHEESNSVFQAGFGSMSEETFPRTSSNPIQAPMHTHLRSIRMFDHLRVLDLTNCSTISDAAIDGIVSNVPRIRNLILAKCTRLTNESVYSISRLGKNLHYLHLGHVSNLTDRAVCHLARSCTRLRYIDLACCPQLTDLSVLELAANLPKLRRIGLVRVTNLTDQAIYSLVERYTSLERIHLSYCENISVPAIFWLLERLTRLTHLSLTGVPSFQKQELQKMCREPPREFNQHQRTAFCVYSGKGVHELRKFLQVVYSGEDPSSSAPFGELTPEVQRVRNNMATTRREIAHHTRSAIQPDSTIANATRGTNGQEYRNSLYHHQASRSEPAQNIVHPTSLHQARDFDSNRTRLAPIGTMNQSIPFSANNVGSSSSFVQRDTRDAMQVDDKIVGRDSLNDETAMNSERMITEVAPELPSTSMPPLTPAAYRAAIYPNSSHQTFSFNGSASRSQDSSYKSAFTEPGRRLGSNTDVHRLNQSPVRRDVSTLAALATPPLHNPNNFFTMQGMNPSGQRDFHDNNNSIYHSTTTPRSAHSYQQSIPQGSIQNRQEMQTTTTNLTSSTHPTKNTSSSSTSSPRSASS